jgi:hypothetical protein
MWTTLDISLIKSWPPLMTPVFVDDGDGAPYLAQWFFNDDFDPYWEKIYDAPYFAEGGWKANSECDWEYKPKRWHPLPMSVVEEA